MKTLTVSIEVPETVDHDFLQGLGNLIAEQSRKELKKDFSLFPNKITMSISSEV